MKLNKKRMVLLSLGLVLLALVIGCFTVGSVDYEKAEEDIETIEYARIESRKLYIESLNMGKSIMFNYNSNEYNEDNFYDEVENAKVYYAKLQHVDMEEIEKYCKYTNTDYDEILNKYNQSLRTVAYVEYAFGELEKSIYDGVIAFADINGLLKNDEVPSDKLDKLEKYDALSGFVEYK